jgi:hypothetical protein
LRVLVGKQEVKILVGITRGDGKILFKLTVKKKHGRLRIGLI